MSASISTDAVSLAGLALARHEPPCECFVRPWPDLLDYGDTNEFFSTLKADRERLINLMASGGLVPVDPADGQ